MLFGEQSSQALQFALYPGSLYCTAGNARSNDKVCRAKVCREHAYSMYMYIIHSVVRVHVHVVLLLQLLVLI